MQQDHANESAIVDSWQSNASPWVSAVRGRQIESRRLVTDQAIIEAVSQRAPRSVLDLGCGEGWLARALAAGGAGVIGVDVVSSLVVRARELGGGDFHCLSFDDVAAGRLMCSVDVAVCNFSLLGHCSVSRLLAGLPALLNHRGAVLIQTLHPLIACGDLPYQDGWRDGSWHGFDAAFHKPAPWYFRTVGSWLALLHDSGLRCLSLLEPLHPTTRQPASIIFEAGCA